MIRKDGIFYGFLWVDVYKRQILILSVILNILCVFMSISLILKRHKILMNILALILSITFIAVSYTHLDVYKRQASSTTTTGISIRATAGGSAEIPSWNKVAGICSPLLIIMV